MLSGCTVGEHEPQPGCAAIGAHMYRSTGDIFDKFESFRDNGVSQVEKLHSSAPGCFNDPDMLIVGMHGDGNVARVGGCTDEEYKMHFALWCMMGAPLMMGGDIRTMNDFCRELMLNRELIAIDQDPEARPPYYENKARYANPVRMGLLKLLSNQEMVLSYFNFADTPLDVLILLRRHRRTVLQRFRSGAYRYLYR